MARIDWFLRNIGIEDRDRRRERLNPVNARNLRQNNRKLRHDYDGRPDHRMRRHRQHLVSRWMDDIPDVG